MPGNIRVPLLVATFLSLIGYSYAEPISGGPDTMFSRIRQNGTEISSNKAVRPGSRSMLWACTRDNATGLTWEIKTEDHKLRDRRWSYTPYMRDWETTKEIFGYKDKSSGKCDRKLMVGGSCNIGAYIEAINQSHLCGHTDWRLPTVGELLDVTAHREQSAGPVRAAIPTPASGWYWTGTLQIGEIPYQRVMLLESKGSPQIFDGTYYLWLVRGYPK